MRRSKDEEDLRSGVAFLLLSLIILTFGAFIFVNRPRAQTRNGVAKKKKKRLQDGGIGNQLLGVMLRVDEGRIRIEEALKNGNAIKAGVKSGDVLLALDGMKTGVADNIEDTFNPILDRMKRARLGQSITLLIQREGEAEPRTIVVPLVVEPGRGPEKRLAERLIRQTIRQLLLQRRGDGWWPHYADEQRPSVGVTALVAHALRRAQQAGLLTPEQAPDLKAAIETLLSVQDEDGGLTDKHHVVQHRVYASALALMASTAGDPTDPNLPDANEAYAEEVEGLRNFLLSVQVQEKVPGQARGYDPIDPRYGGWSYHDSFRSRRLRTDLSTARFALQALSDAAVPDDHAAWQRAGLYLDLVQNYSVVTPPDDPAYAREKALRDGGFAFTPRMSKAGEKSVSEELAVYRSYGSATADGVLSLLALRNIDRRSIRGRMTDDPRVLAGLRWLATHYTVDYTPGFGPRSPWRQGLRFYYLAALAEAFHRAGVWKIVPTRGPERVWAADIIKILAAVRAPLGGFRNESGYMHEDSESIAASFALIALVAARQRLSLAEDESGGALKAGAAPPPQARDADLPLPPPSDVLARGEALFKARCSACHREDAEGTGPSLRDVGDIYLGAEGRSAARAKARMKRFVRDPLTTKSLIKHDGNMIAISEKQVSDADLDAVLEYLLHR